MIDNDMTTIGGFESVWWFQQTDKSHDPRMTAGSLEKTYLVDPKTLKTLNQFDKIEFRG